MILEGMVDDLSGRLFFAGSTERLTTARDCAFLTSNTTAPAALGQVRFILRPLHLQLEEPLGLGGLRHLAWTTGRRRYASTFPAEIFISAATTMPKGLTCD